MLIENLVNKFSAYETSISIILRFFKTNNLPSKIMLELNKIYNVLFLDGLSNLMMKLTLVVGSKPYNFSFNIIASFKTQSYGRLRKSSNRR